MLRHNNRNICAFKKFGSCPGNEYKIITALDIWEIISEGCPDNSSGAVSFNRIADLLTCSYTHTTNSRAVIF